ncbi:MAG: tRNA-dihydrouridine synthase family protein [Desulforhopalus sp.]|jgi:nifR3 family TIM-barrel protein|nr:tRNA-dihydrouridine synthase family protein [Desulforhopalus sp.]
MPRNTFSVRNLQISPPLALAPMVGLSHSALRSLVQEEGGVGLLFTEMLAARRVPHDNPRCSPLLVRSSEERPLFYQLVAADPQLIAPAVEKLHQLDAQGIDLNLGCPAPLLRKQGAGATLVGNRRALTDILQELRRRTELPVSVKIRLGEREDSGELLALCRVFVDQGVDMLTVHARLNGEKFCRRPRWHLISAIKEKIHLPVLANGGIFTVEDARKCLDQSGADGLMLGRGVVTRPWLCADIATELFDLPHSRSMRTPAQLYCRYIALIEERFAPERRLGRLKQFTHYFAAGFPFGHHLTAAVQGSGTLAEAVDRAGLFFEQNALKP